MENVRHRSTWARLGSRRASLSLARACSRTEGGRISSRHERAPPRSQVDRLASTHASNLRAECPGIINGHVSI